MGCDLHFEFSAAGGNIHSCSPGDIFPEFCQLHSLLRQLLLPLFVRPGRKLRHAVPSMPGVFQLSIDEAVREAAAAQKAGVPGVILFGIPSKKDARASGAYAKNGIVQKAVRQLKRDVPGLLVITDVWTCAS